MKKVADTMQGSRMLASSVIAWVLTKAKLARAPGCVRPRARVYVYNYICMYERGICDSLRVDICARMYV